jgi:Ca-activated chloride channel homolog
MPPKTAGRIGLIAIVLSCLIPCLNGQDKRSQVPLFRVDVGTVFVKVLVSDPLNRCVTGLNKENFKLYEDNVEQTLSHFSQQSAPVSIGILFDISSSMGFTHNFLKARNEISRFLKSGIPGDQYCLVTFNDKVDLAQKFVDESAALQDDVVFRRPGGSTALYEAVYRGLSVVREGRNEKKALILITDGEDNSSRYTRNEVREFAKESDVQIYSLGLFGPEGYGYSLLKDLATITGGRVFTPNPMELDYYIELIHAELRNQYLLGYVPTNTAHDGQWRRIRVRLDVPAGLPKLSVVARDGYYAPK